MLVKHYLELAKIRLTAMVLVTTAIGYCLASSRPINGAMLAATVLGTGLAAVGACTFNQILEIRRDALMERTRRRPLPAGRISRGHAFAFAMLTSAAGIAILIERVNPLTALLGLLNLVVYTLVYTPLKPRTSINTLLGSLCGGLPPVMGWTGAGGRLSAEPGLLFLILLLWQIPHFLSFVWLYRADYARAGYCMLPVTDPDGRLTCLLILLYSLALLPVGLAVTLCGMAGYLFGASSLALGLVLFLLALRLYRARSAQNARRLFLASIAYLPMLLVLLVADAQPPRPQQVGWALPTKTREVVVGSAHPTRTRK